MGVCKYWGPWVKWDGAGVCVWVMGEGGLRMGV